MVLHFLRCIVTHHDAARPGTRAARHRLCATHPFHSAHAHLFPPRRKAERTFRGRRGVFQDLTVGELLPGCPALLRSLLDGPGQRHHCGRAMLVVSTTNRARHCTTSSFLIASTSQWATEATHFCIAWPPPAGLSLGLDEHVGRFGTHRFPTVLVAVATSPTAFLRDEPLLASEQPV